VSVSGPCSSGYYCMGSAATATPTRDSSALYGICPPGSYCPVQSVRPINCPTGTYSRAAGATSVSLCEQCPSGFYCPANVTSLDAALAAKIACPLGHYCMEGSVTGVESPCPVGTVGSRVGLQTLADCSNFTAASVRCWLVLWRKFHLSYSSTRPLPSGYLLSGWIQSASTLHSGLLL
jgi:hypothetical protein